MRIMITGPQGSGKTTQAQILSRKFNLCFIGAGDLARDFARGRGRENKKVRKSLEEGQLIDNKIMARLIREGMRRPECRLGCVTDGYPRSLEQIEDFNPHYDKVIYLEISDPEAKRRLCARGREDDTPEIISERLSWYHQEVKPLLDHYRKQGKLVVVDGEKPVADVAAAVEKALRES